MVEEGVAAVPNGCALEAGETKADEDSNREAVTNAETAKTVFVFANNFMLCRLLL